MTLPFPAFFVHAGLQKRRRKEEKGKEGEKKAVWDEVSNPHKICRLLLEKSALIPKKSKEKTREVCSNHKEVLILHRNFAIITFLSTKVL